MKKFPPAEHSVYEWPYQPASEDKRQGKHLNKNHSEEKKQTPEQMIRSLKGIFCKGRYSSWALSKEN